MKVAVGLRRVAAGKRTSGRRAAQIAVLPFPHPYLLQITFPFPAILILCPLREICYLLIVTIIAPFWELE